MATKTSVGVGPEPALAALKSNYTVKEVERKDMAGVELHRDVDKSRAATPIQAPALSGTGNRTKIIRITFHESRGSSSQHKDSAIHKMKPKDMAKEFVDILLRGRGLKFYVTEIKAEAFFQGRSVNDWPPLTPGPSADLISKHGTFERLNVKDLVLGKVYKIFSFDRALCGRSGHGCRYYVFYKVHVPTPASGPSRVALLGFQFGSSELRDEEQKILAREVTTDPNERDKIFGRGKLKAKSFLMPFVTRVFVFDHAPGDDKAHGSFWIGPQDIDFTIPPSNLADLLRECRKVLDRHPGAALTKNKRGRWDATPQRRRPSLVETLIPNLLDGKAGSYYGAVCPGGRECYACRQAKKTKHSDNIFKNNKYNIKLKDNSSTPSHRSDYKMWNPWISPITQYYIRPSQADVNGQYTDGGFFNYKNLFDQTTQPSTGPYTVKGK